MKTFQVTYPSAKASENFRVDQIPFTPNMILIFGSRQTLTQSHLVKAIRDAFPGSILTGCSTSGEISGTNVNDHTLSLTAVEFEKTNIVYHEADIRDFNNGIEAGKYLAQQFVGEGLKHIFILSEGLNVNGTELVNGLRDNLKEGVAVTGGLAGDGPDFNKTVIVSNSGHIKDNIITAIGFYGEHINIGCGSFGGWDSFGIERSVSKSKGNVVYEIDNTPALELYKSFLGDKANELPASGLLFPVNMRAERDGVPVVRTILAVDEEKQSLTFAGDIPEGSYIRLMKANIDRLISGAEEAARISIDPLPETTPDLAVLISCVGRKLVLKQLIEEEVEAVQDIVGAKTTLTGFYSYGEIAPFLKGGLCELHNQTMTITTFKEN